MEQLYATKADINGFGERVMKLEIAHGKTETKTDRNSEDIDKLIAYTNGLLLKVSFVTCIPVLIMILKDLLTKN